MINYKPKDFAKCLYNPLEADLLERYPVLLQLFAETFLEAGGVIMPKEFDMKVLRYAMACYDPASPLVQDYPEWNDRKYAALELAGFDAAGEAADKIAHNKDEEAMVLIHVFLRKCIKSRVWAMIVSNEEMFWEYNQRLQQQVSKAEKDKGDKEKDMVQTMVLRDKLREAMRTIHSDLNGLYAEFYGSDKAFEEAASLNIRFTAEGIGKQLAKNKNK